LAARLPSKPCAHKLQVMHHLLRIAHALKAWQVTVLMPNVMSTDYKSTLEAYLFTHLSQP